MNSTRNENQSRWGFHPCNYELFHKLKRLHRWYWQTVYDFHRWHRWWRKEVQNRVGTEPVFCADFVQDKPWFKPVRIHGEAACKVYQKTVVDCGIVDLYQQARMPKSEPVELFETEAVERIEELYLAVSGYFGE